MRIFLLIVFALCYFMLFSALKLIGETIHELAMLFFSKDLEGKTVYEARGGNVIFFFGAIASAFGIQSIFDPINHSFSCDVYLFCFCYI